jgi:hypothetical protein
MRKYAFLAVAGCLMLVVACRKNTSTPGGQTGQLVGNYTFLYLTTNINATESVTYLGQTASVVLAGGYKTVQNTGTVVFTADSAIGKGIGYSFDTTAMEIRNIPGTPADTTYQQLSDTVPPTSSSSKYTIIGADSVYFPGGVLGTGSVLAGSPIPVAPPTGGHFSFVGDTLIITTKINTTYPDNSLGVPATVNANVNATIKLLKQ